MHEFTCGCNSSSCVDVPKGGICVRKHLRCDGCADCPQGSDEENCQCRTRSLYQCGCRHDQMQCNAGRECVYSTRLCDGTKDCKDGSDEVGCKRCNADEFCCDKQCSTCVSRDKVCNLVSDCPGGNDEVNCCSRTRFACSDRSSIQENLRPRIVAGSVRCNGNNDCGDWSDEVNCEYQDMFKCHCHRGNQVACTEVAAVTSAWQCDGYHDCHDDYSDEICDCSDKQIKCAASGVCLGINMRCNGRNDCGDWSDETGCTCSNDEFQCACYSGNITCSGSRGCISTRLVCDGRNDCGDWSDEAGCTCPVSKPIPCECYVNEQDLCPTNTGCISLQGLCDGKNQCGDWSDELGCPCGNDEVRCGCINSRGNCAAIGRCISKKRLNDGVVDCREGDDEFWNSVLFELTLWWIVNKCSVSAWNSSYGFQLFFNLDGISHR